MFFAALDQTVVVTALPEMVGDLGIEIGQLDRASWIVTGFLMGYVVALPVAGRLADMTSKRRVYLGALALFAVASLAAALSRDLWILVGARVLQAAGGGALVPVTLAWARELFTGRQRALAMGLVVATAEAGGVVGPLWGAAITDLLAWPWIFYLNIPIATLIGFGVWRLPEAAPRLGGRLDYVGAVLATAALAALTAGLARDQVLPGPVVGALLAAGVVGLVAFIGLQRRRADGLVNVRHFERLPILAGLAATLLVGAALIVPMVNLPLFAAIVLDRGTLEGGLLLLQLTLMIPVGAVVGGAVAARFGYPPPTLAGASLAAAGLMLAGQWPANVDDVTMTRDLLIAGLGFGVLVAPLTGAVVSAAGDAHAGTAAGLVTVARLLGMTIALAALTPWALDRFNAALVAGEQPSAIDEVPASALAAALEMFNALFIVAAALSATIAVPAAGLAWASWRERAARSRPASAR